MDLLRFQPSLQLLQYAFEGYSLSEEEIRSLIESGWSRALPRDLLPVLRRSRLLSWEISRLQERRRDRMPSSHWLAKTAEIWPGIRRGRERELADLSARINEKEKERSRIFAEIAPLETTERDRLASFRPVSDNCCLRLTDEGKRILADFRFSKACLPLVEMPDGIERRLLRLEETYRALISSPWWINREKRIARRSAEEIERDALWLSAVLSRSEEDASSKLARAEETIQRFSRQHLWNQDPLPLCLILLSTADRAVETVFETNNAMVNFGVGVGVSLLAGATHLTAWTPSPELALRISDFHRFWKALTGYGIAFSDSLIPEASRLATVRRPVEKTALLFKTLDNRVTRFNRMDERSTRIAASVLADLALDYRERKENDLYNDEEAYLLNLMRRYRSLHAAMIPRCHLGNAVNRATLYAGLLSIFPGDVSSILDLFDQTRRRLIRLNLPRAIEDAGFALLTMDSFCREEWGVNHSRFVWELRFA